MPSTDERLQNIWHKFDASREHRPSSARQACARAVAEGLLELPEPADPLDILADRMAQALRNEYDTDEQGRRYRVNHAVRITRGGVQYTFWGVMGYASHEHMEKAFAQRRDQIVGDNLQLKIDVDVYNDMISGKHTPIQMVLDYTEDVAERQELLKMQAKKSAA